MAKNLKKKGNNERRDSNSSDGERELATMKESQQRNHGGNKRARDDAIDSSVPFESDVATVQVETSEKSAISPTEGKAQ